MLKTIKTILFVVLLAATATGCSRDVDYLVPGENEVAVRKVTYSVNDERWDIVLRGEAEWDDFVAKLFDKVDEGCLASFVCTSTSIEPVAAKRPLSLKTADRDEAYKWASERGKEGYVVVVSYDKRNKVYKCQALKK